MEDILAQMQVVILAEHNAKVRCLEEEVAALRNKLSDKETLDRTSVLCAEQHGPWMRCPENCLTSPHASILLSDVCSLKITDALGNEVIVHVHCAVLDQIPYFTAKHDFAQRARSQGEQTCLVLPPGCPCDCVTLVLWRLYLGVDCHIGSPKLPVPSLADAIAIGKVADMLMLETLLAEIGSVAKRLAFRTDETKEALKDPCLPDFLQPLKTQMLRTPLLSEANISAMLVSAANSYQSESRDQAEQLLKENSASNLGVPVASALTQIMQQCCVSLDYNRHDDNANLAWLLDLAQSHIDDPVAMAPFFKQVSTTQVSTSTTYMRSGKRRNDRMGFNALDGQRLRKAFEHHMDQCGSITIDCLSDALGIAIACKAEEINHHASCEVRKTFPNVLDIKLLKSDVVPSALAKSALLGCRSSLMDQINGMSIDTLIQVCQPQLLRLFTAEEELGVSQKIADHGVRYMQSWATVPIIAVLGAEARRLVCMTLSSCLGQLSSEVREALRHELQ